MLTYDFCVIGAGWAGFNAALRARDLGLKACLIEKSFLGGTCLNTGCIPTKLLLQSAKLFSSIKKSDLFGITVSDPGLNLESLQQKKAKLLNQLRNGMNSQLKCIDYLNAEAEIISAEEIKAGPQRIKTKFMLAR